MPTFSKIAFNIAFVLDCIAILIALFFVAEDFPNNGSLSLVLLVLCGWVGGSYYFYTHGQKALGIILAWIPAVPMLLYGLFILMFIVLKPDMR